jgi:glycerol-3-phosphate acyltransferase PlsY
MTMLLASVLLIVGAYLVGSIPSAYLIARWRRGIDPRAVGSGNVGASNLRLTVGLWAAIAVAVIDIAKGVVPVWLGLKLGLGVPTAYAAGVAAVVGHDWSVWLNFQGGRGGATTVGAFLVAFPPAAVWIMVLVLVGGAIHWAAPLHAFAALMVPVWSLALGRPPAVFYLALAMIVLMFVKRLEANQRFAAPPGERAEVWRNRLLLDRDSRRRAA